VGRVAGGAGAGLTLIVVGGVSAGAYALFLERIGTDSDFLVEGLT